MLRLKIAAALSAAKPASPSSTAPEAPGTPPPKQKRRRRPKRPPAAARRARVAYGQTYGQRARRYSAGIVSAAIAAKQADEVSGGLGEVPVAPAFDPSASLTASASSLTGSPWDRAGPGDAEGAELRAVCFVRRYRSKHFWWSDAATSRTGRAWWRVIRSGGSIVYVLRS